MPGRYKLQVFVECKNCGWQKEGPKFWAGQPEPPMDVPTRCPDCEEEGEIEKDVTDVMDEDDYHDDEEDTETVGVIYEDIGPDYGSASY